MRRFLVASTVVALVAGGCAGGAGGGREQDDARRDLDRAQSRAEAAVDDVEKAFATILGARALPGRGSFQSCTDVGTTDPRFVVHLLFGDLPRDASEALATALGEAGWTVEEPESPGHVPAQRGTVRLSADIQDGGATVRIQTGCVESPDEVAEEYVDRPVTRYPGAS